MHLGDGQEMRHPNALHENGTVMVIKHGNRMMPLGLKSRPPEYV